jgi:hypothetical protein
VTTEKTFRHQTSVDISNGRGFGPVNQFNPVRSFITPEDRSVVDNALSPTHQAPSAPRVRVIGFSVMAGEKDDHA